MEDISFVGFHFLPLLALTPGAAATQTPSHWTRKLTDIKAWPFKFFHLFNLSSGFTGLWIESLLRKKKSLILLPYVLGLRLTARGAEIPGRQNLPGAS